MAASHTKERSTSEVRAEFSTKEGEYKNIKASEYSRPSRQPLFGKELSQVQLSFVSCKDKDGLCEWILFNSGKELYFYPFEGVGKQPDLKKPTDKRVYKTPTVPVCHDFNLITRSTKKVDLIVGFATGPLQYLNPIDRHAICAFNEDGSIDSTRVTCVKWVPGSENTFISSHRSGNLYVWTTEHSTKSTGQLNYVSHKEIHDATICTVKPKNKFPVLFRWSIGHGAINSFAFSPDLIHIAIASQDGFLRVYNFEKQEIYGRMRSYYGALLCVCWSPDGRYTVTGGEDDLINVWSFEHRRVVARGEGHKSYVSAVAFDPYTTILPDHGFSASSRFSICSSEDGFPSPSLHSQSKSTLDSTSSPHLGRLRSESSTRERCTAAYRLGSVGQDTQLCLWDLSGDSLRLRRPFSRSRSRLSRPTSRPQSIADLQQSPKSKDEKGTSREEQKDSSEKPTPHSLTSDPETSVSKTVISNHVSTSQNSSGKSGTDFSDTKESALSDTSEQSSEKGNGKKERKPKKEKGEKKVRLVKDPVRKVMRFVGGIGSGTHLYRREVGTFETCNSDDIAPKMDEVNHIEPLLAKKISHERLTALVFREDCIVTACQEGFIHTWSRPDTVLPAEADKPHSRPTTSSVSSNHPGLNSPRPGAEYPVKNTTV